MFYVIPEYDYRFARLLCAPKSKQEGNEIAMLFITFLTLKDRSLITKDSSNIGQLRNAFVEIQYV